MTGPLRSYMAALVAVAVYFSFATPTPDYLLNHTRAGRAIDSFSFYVLSPDTVAPGIVRAAPHRRRRPYTRAKALVMQLLYQTRGEGPEWAALREKVLALSPAPEMRALPAAAEGKPARRAPAPRAAQG